MPERTDCRASTVVDSASKGMSPFTVSMTSSSLLYTRPHTFRTRSKKHATSMAMLKVSASAALTTARAAHGLPAPSSLATLVLENILTDLSNIQQLSTILLINMQLVVREFTDGHKDFKQFRMPHNANTCRHSSEHANTCCKLPSPLEFHI